MYSYISTVCATATRTMGRAKRTHCYSVVVANFDFNTNSFLLSYYW